jgi:DNA-binding beta-propeller fold protein YncE
MSTVDGGSGRHAQVVEAPEAGGHTAPEDPKRRRKLIVLAIIGILLLLVAAAFAWYLITRKPLTSLPILGHEPMPTYKSSIYGVNKPLAVAVSPDGQHIYVTQSGGARTVVELDASGAVVATFKTPADKAVGHLPAYIAINPVDGTVAVSDTMAKQVYVYTANGTYKRTVRPAGVKAWTPLGVAYDAQGNLLVSDVGGKTHSVLVLDGQDKVLRTLAPEDQAFSFPNGITVNADGDVFVADSNNGRLIAFDKDGRMLGSANRGVAEGDLGLPRGVAADNGDRIYVVDTTNQMVKTYKLRDDGSLAYIGFFGDEGIDDGLFEYPNGVATDNRSTVYVTDRENNRVQVWSF